MRLMSTRGPGDISVRKEENCSKQSQKEGGKVCKMESGLIAGRIAQLFHKQPGLFSSKIQTNKKKKKAKAGIHNFSIKM